MENSYAHPPEYICGRKTSDRMRYCRIQVVTFLFTTAKTSNSVTSYTIFPLNHHVQTSIPKPGVQSPLNNSEEVLIVLCSRLFMMSNAPIQPSHRSFHCFF